MKSTPASGKIQLEQQQHQPHGVYRQRNVLAALLLVMAAAAVVLLSTVAGSGSATETTCNGQEVTVDIGAGQWTTGGADVVLGTPGDDVIFGWGGDDVICGAGGNDTINGGGGFDTCDGGSGTNTVSCEQVNRPAVSPTPTQGAGALTCDGKDVTVDLNAGGWTTGRADVVMGTPGDDEIFGWGGNDTICGGGGDDTIVGGAGIDACGGDNGNNDLDCEVEIGSQSPESTPSGVPTCGGMPATVVLGEAGWTTGAADVVVGTPGDDVIFGWGGDDIICGGGGNDTIVGGGGNDSCDGGSGSNSVDCELGIGPSTPPVGPTPPSPTPTSTSVPANPTPTPSSGEPTPTGTPVDLGPTEGQFCSGLAVTVYLSLGQWPTSGNDVILGTPQDDIINGFGGNDTICGAAGDDKIHGGTGSDNIRGGEGDDHLAGQQQRDTLHGGAGNDQLLGGDGNDELLGAGGADNLWGGSGHDTLRGGGQDDLLYGGPGADQLFGESDNDELRGNDGDDTLRGGSGSDHLRGNAGSDSLYGDDGIDTCVGGTTAIEDPKPQCESTSLDPAPSELMVANPWEVPASGPEALVDWEIAVTFSQNDPGDVGFVDFKDGTKQYVSSYCRSNLEMVLPVVVQDWATYTDPLGSHRPPLSCSAMMLAATGSGELNRPEGSAPDGYPQLIAKNARSTQSWMDFGDGHREELTAACRATLEERGIITVVAEWDYISALSLADRYRGPQACSSLVTWYDQQEPVPGQPGATPAPTATPLPPANEANEIHPLGFRVLDNAADSGDHGWFDFGNNTKQFVTAPCRARLVAMGAQLVSPDFNTVTKRIPSVQGAGYQCDELVAKILSPAAMSSGGNFTTVGSQILDPHGDPFVPYGVNVSGDFYVSESWNSKPIDKLGVYRGTWGFNTLRINAFCLRACNNTGTLEDTSVDVHELIEAYKGTGVVLIVDFHSLDFPNLPSDDEIGMVTDYFADLAERYRDNPYVWFNPFNEPINECDLDKHGEGLAPVKLEGDASSTWVSMHVPVLDAIREAGNNNIISLTASNFGQDRCQNHTGGIAPFQSSILTFGPELSATYANLTYDLHFYSRWGNTTEHAVTDYFDRLEDAGLAVYVGEIGGDPESGFNYQRADFVAAEAFFAWAPDDIGVLAWHSAFGYSLVSTGGDDAFAITPNDGTRPTNLSLFGELMWDHLPRAPL